MRYKQRKQSSGLSKLSQLFTKAGHSEPDEQSRSDQWEGLQQLEPRLLLSAVMDPGTGHFYELVETATDITWQEARDAASQRSYSGLPGHLATITSEAENSFIYSNVLNDTAQYSAFLGGYQEEGSDEPDGGWRWVTDEAWPAQGFWKADEPNNSGGNEDSLEIGTASEPNSEFRGRWNDTGATRRCYVVEYDSLRVGATAADFIQQILESSIAPRDVALEDINVDGQLDIISVPAGNNTHLEVWFSDGLGGYEGSSLFPVGRHGYDIATSDFNMDGYPDLVTTARWLDSITLLFGQPDGSLGGRQDIYVGDYPMGAVTADLNADGFPDIAVHVTGYENSQETPHIAVLYGVGDGTFVNRQNYEVSPGRELAAGDFNGDGRLDLAVPSLSEDSVTVIFGQSTGEFGTPISIEVGDGPVGIVAEDFDLDGYCDFAVACSYSNEIVALYGNADGNFEGKQSYATSSTPWAIASGDFNGDRLPDLVVTYYSSDVVSVFYTQTTGNLGLCYDIEPLPGSAGYPSAATGDLNNDGYDDIVVGSQSDNLFAIYYGNMSAMVNHQRPLSVDYADFDGDGDIDFVAGSDQNVVDDVVWYRNDGPGGFTAQPIAASANQVWWVQAEDLDDDGDIDILTASEKDGKVSWFENDGTGNFAAQQIIGLGSKPHGVDVADIDGDGDQDVLAAMLGSADVVWFANDGQENFSAAMVVGSPSGVRHVRAADLDGDGDIDVVAPSYASNAIVWYANDGGGHFGGARVITASATGAWRVEIADVNGDGNIDVLSASAGDHKAAWYANDGAGNFGPQQIITTNVPSAWGVHAVDLDNDGDPDVLVAAPSQHDFAWYENDGAGSFTPHVLNAGSDAVSAVSAADLDGDGDADVLAALLDANRIVWYENATVMTTGVAIGIVTPDPQAVYAPGDTVEITIDVTNIGPAFSARVTLNVFDSTFVLPDLSPDDPASVYDSFVIGADQFSDGLLETGETEQFVFTVPIPEGALQGQYRLVAAVRDASMDFNDPLAVKDTTGPAMGIADWTETAYIDGFFVHEPPSLGLYQLASATGFTQVGDRYEALNTTVQLGLAPTSGESFTSLLTVDGDVWYTDTSIHVDGMVYAAVGGISAPLFNGSFELDVNELITSALNDALSNAVGEYQFGGVALNLSRIEIADPTGGSTEDARLEIEGSLQLPESLGSVTIAVQGSNEIIIDAGGVSLSGAALSFPDADFELLGVLDASATGLYLEYSSLDEALTIQGALEVSLISGLGRFEANFAGDNYIRLSEASGLEVVGFLAAEDVEIVPGVWEIKSAEILFDVTDSGFSVRGDATVLIPTGIEVSAGLGFYNGNLNYLSLGADGLGLPIGATGAYLQEINGLIDHIADPEPVAFGGGVGATAGPEISINMPALLPWDDFTGSLLRIDIDGLIDSRHLEGTGTVDFVSGFATMTATVDLNWYEGYLSVEGDLDILNGFITGASSFEADSQLNVNMTGQAAVTFPAMPFIGSLSYDLGNYILEFSRDDNDSNDFVAGWVVVDELDLAIGARLTLAGDWDWLNAEEINQIVDSQSMTLTADMMSTSSLSGDAPVYGADASSITAAQYLIDPGTNWVMFSAEWDTPNAAAQLVLEKPDGTTLDEADIVLDPSVSVVTDLTTDKRRVVRVESPDAGTWLIRVADDTGLGTVEYYSLVGVGAPTVNFTSVSGGQERQPVHINLEAYDTDSDANVSLYYDRDGTGFSGIKITDGLVEPDGPLSYTWDVSQMIPGDYYIYAMVDDGVSAPVFAYADGPATITSNTAISSRHLFYNRSSFDGNSAAANSSDDAAIATDKTALLPGETASFANYSSYDRGINGVMVDITNATNIANLSAADFQFKVGNDSNPDGWSALATSVQVSVREGAGTNGSDRVTLIFPDNAIRNTWLEVTVLANANTGLPGDDVFYFGNAVGETGNSPADTFVNAADGAGARENPRSGRNPAPIDFAWDINRDGFVNALDGAIIRENPASGRNDLNLITVPVSAAVSASQADEPTAPSAPILNSTQQASYASSSSDLLDRLGLEEEDESDIWVDLLAGEPLLEL
jgi:hypothetical protein